MAACGPTRTIPARPTVATFCARPSKGCSRPAGKIFCGLWVTKIAPPERASSYMSVHMALTGVRGSLAPFLGYWIFAAAGPTAVAICGLALVALSMALFEAANETGSAATSAYEKPIELSSVVR